MLFIREESSGWMSPIVRTVKRLHEWFKRILSARPALKGFDIDGVSHLALVSVIFALFFAFVGPENASGLGFVMAFAVWFTMSMLTFAALFVCDRYLKQKNIAFAWAWAVLPGTLVAAIFSVITEILLPELEDQKPNVVGYLMEVPHDYIIILPQVFVVYAVYHWATRTIAPARNAGDDHEIPMSKEFADFIKKLPPKIGADIIAVSSEAHYVRVYTPLGNALILGSLNETEKALSGLNMIRIHRSHTVNGRHIRNIAATDVDLTTGLVLPLSRRRAADVKEAWRSCRTSANPPDLS